MQSTVRPDKNKADGVAGILAALDGDLEGLLVSLDAYERSSHPERFEALRWHLPILRQRCRELARASSAQATID